MSENTIATPPAQRITVIDALRGFALLGVILMHMLDHFGFTAANISGVSSPSTWDTIIQWFTNTMIKGKFISIFSFLFGLSFYIQMDRASKKGTDFRGRFLWRMLLLFVIGLIGTSFVYVDILVIYAVFGVVLVFLYPLKNWFLMILVSLLLLGVPTWFIIGLDNIRFDNVMNEPPAVSVPLETVGRSVENSTLEGTTFLQSAKENLTVKTLDKLKFQFVHSNTGYMILALFILGFIVGRLRFFEQVHIRKKRNSMLFLLFLVSTFIILMAIKLMPDVPNLSQIGARSGEIPFAALIISALSTLSTVTLSGTLAMGFITLYQVTGIRRYLNLLTPYGRMGLTNYEMQNVVGGILFSVWGFGSVFGNKGAAELFVLGLVIYTLQVLISRYWVKRFLYGPLEWLWRSGTYLKWQPFKRK
ncbi:uncharacterized protein SAMN05216357_106107 [Porphyromonadaceae bacterium KH3CP3RA]|nr:uncharacterized protein SAMN05216357_106107 [Porphyromonadaceae bacterium KH3CP3RA]